MSYTTIDTLTNLIHSNCAYDVPVEYIVDSHGLDMRGAHRNDPVITNSTTLYTYLRESFRKLLKCGDSKMSPVKIPKYPIHMINNQKYLDNPLYGRQTVLTRPIPLIHAETNESFKLIATILNEQNQRILKLEESLNAQAPYSYQRV